MAKIYQNLTELIGNTPLLKLQHLSQTHKAKANIIAKLEFFNPGGSVKDRIALAMIEDAEQKRHPATWLSYHRTDKRQHRCRSCMGSVRKRL